LREVAAELEVVVRAIDEYATMLANQFLAACNAHDHH